MRVVLFANTDWYLYNFRRSLALSLQQAGHDVLLLSPEGAHGEKLRSLGLRWQPFRLERRSLNPLREAGVLYRLVRILRQERPDLVHGFTVKCAVYGSLAARIAGVPARVNAVAGMGYVFTSSSVKARILRPIVRTLLKLALGGSRVRLILQNPDDVELFTQARLIAPSEIRLIRGSGVDCDLFSPSQRPASRPVRVLLPARLLWDKGLAEYVEAARSLKAEGCHIEFLLAGDPDPGNPASVPDTTARGWVKEGVVSWLGRVDDMASLFRSVQVVCLPSYREGLPKSLIEAGACGCALVTTDVPGCREVVTNDVDGLRIPARDAIALGAALRRLYLDPHLCERLGRAAREKAVREFDVKRINTLTLRVYEELLENP